MLQKIFRVLASLTLLLAFTHAGAAISLSGTRLVYKAKEQGASITVRNGESDVLIQSWIESDDPGDVGDVPFAVTPPLVNLPANKQQLLRVLHAGDGSLPADRESVLWLNVQEIPQSADGENVLQVAIRQRIKIFFRPTGLLGEPAEAAGELQWQLVRGDDGRAALQVVNAGEYHVSMGDISLDGGAGEPELVTGSTMVAPGQTALFPVQQFAPGATPGLRFDSINDYGGRDPHAARLAKDAPVRAPQAPRSSASTSLESPQS